jgi:hypothetical protein
VARPSEELLTVFEIARRTGKTLKSVRDRLSNARILMVKRAGNRGLYPWRLVVKAMKVTHASGAVCPKGMVFVRELAKESGVSASTLRGAVSAGQLAGVRVHAGGEQFQVAIRREDAAEFLARHAEWKRKKAERKALLDSGLTRLEADRVERRRKLLGLTPPILSHDHEVCLQARRELWLRNNRAWPKIGLAAKSRSR